MVLYLIQKVRRSVRGEGCEKRIRREEKNWVLEAKQSRWVKKQIIKASKEWGPIRRGERK